PAALHHFGDAVDVDNLFREVALAVAVIPVPSIPLLHTAPRFQRRPRAEEISLEAEPGLAGGVGQRLDAAMILEATAVEDDLRHARALCPLRHQRADLLGDLALAALDLLQVRLEVGRRRQRLAGGVVDHLRVDVREAAEHRQPRALLRAVYPLAQPQVP